MKILIDIPDHVGKVFLGQMSDAPYLEMCSKVAFSLGLLSAQHLVSGNAEDHATEMLIATMAMSYVNLVHYATFTEVPAAPFQGNN